MLLFGAPDSRTQSSISGRRVVIRDANQESNGFSRHTVKRRSCSAMRAKIMGRKTRRFVLRL